jgi:CO/xanthine dehydrogenase Mo-binding subunit
VSLTEDGSALVMSGCPDIGGSRASLALMAAEELGIPVERVRPVVVDTESIGFNDLTGGSRVTFATGMAVIEAARAVVRQLRARAAQTWGIELDAVHGRTPGRAQTAPRSTAAQPRLATRAAATGDPITGRSSLTAPARQGFATHLCDVRGRSRDRRQRCCATPPWTRAGGASELRRRPDAERRRAGHRLGAERGLFARGVMENAGFLDYRIPVTVTCR